jgi:hypothetical protein
MSELAVDLEALTGLAEKLGTAAADLGGWGGSPPGLPGSGAGAAQAAAISSHLVEQIAHLCLALESASEALVETSQSYSAVDERSASRGTGLMAAM